MNNLKITLLLSYICLASISSAIITPALPNIQIFYSLSKGNVEWMVSIFLLGYMLGQLIYAPIANSYGRIKVLQIGLSINLVGVAMCIISSYSDHYLLLLIGRLITAFGAACGLTCTFILINELLDPQKAKQVVSMSMIAFTVGIGFSVLLGGVITQYWQWQGCFILLFIHGAVMLILTKQFPETLKIKKSVHPKSILLHYFAAFKNAKLIIFSLIVGFVSVFFYGYSAAAPIYTRMILHLSESQYGYWNCLNMVGMCGGGFLSAYLLKNRSEKNVLILGFTLISLGIIGLITLSLLTIKNPLFFFLITNYIFLITGLLFSSASYLASNSIADRASASSVMSFINIGSGMIGVIILGYLPFHSLLSFSIVLVCFYIVVILLFFHQTRLTTDVNITNYS